ncbi:MAG: RDD family protein [Acidimicrobiales bacterium]
MALPYEDRVSIATPEGVAVELVLAGLGSRFIARILDSLVQAGFILAWLFLLVASNGAAVVVAIGVVGAFLGWFAYDIAFEALASGRTPGKRWSKLRVVAADGGPVGVGASAVRNLLRLVDFLPAVYAVGAIAIVVTSRNQRIGDLAAGTLVVREWRAAPVSIDEVRLLAPPGSRGWMDLSVWDVSSVTAEEVAVVRRFLQRRPSLDPNARHRLGTDLAARLHPKVVGAPDRLPSEVFLEGVVAAKAARG